MYAPAAALSDRREREIDSGTATDSSARSPTATVRFGRNWRASVIAVAPFVPSLGTCITIGALLRHLHTPDVPVPEVARPLHYVVETPLVAGIINVLIAWFLLWIVYQVLGLSDVSRANAVSYNALLDRLEGVKARRDQAGELLKAHERVHDEGTCDDCLLRQAAWQEVNEHIKRFESELGRPGPHWATGTGYIALWKRVLTAEEALIQLEPVESVIAGAHYDELRCRGSAISYRDDLQKRVVLAAGFLRSLQTTSWQVLGAPAVRVPVPDPSGRRTPIEVASAWIRRSRLSGWVRRARLVVVSVPSDSVKGPRSEAEARTTLRRVRHSINQFRTERWAGLVRARNQLMTTTGLTGLALYAAVWLGIMMLERYGPEGRDPAEVIAYAALFFLIGGAIGLFNQCYRDTKALTAVDDYGLTPARLMATPLVSGVAAVSGVVLILSATAGLHDFTSPDKLAFNVVAAATFGLTPTILLDRLLQQTEQFKAEIRASEAVETSKQADASPD